MTLSEALSIFRESLFTMLKLSLPLLLVSMAIGLIISIFQAATQIHEQTLTFVPKIIVMVFLLLMLGSWMMTVLMELFYKLTQIMLII